MTPLMAVLAQTSTPDLSAWLIGTPVTVLAFLTFAWMRGWIVAGPTHDRALKRQDEQAAEIRQLVKDVIAVYDRAVPVLARATDLMARAAEAERSR